MIAAVVTVLEMAAENSSPAESIAVMARRCAVESEAPCSMTIGFAVAAKHIRHFEHGEFLFRCSPGIERFLFCEPGTVGFHREIPVMRLAVDVPVGNPIRAFAGPMRGF